MSWILLLFFSCILCEWVKIEDPASSSLLKLHFAIKHEFNAFEWLQNKLLEVSDPLGLKYGKYVTIEDLKEKLWPTNNLQEVTLWMQDRGFEHSISGYGDFVTMFASLEQIESIFKTKIHRYRHSTSNRVHLTSEEYELPRELISFVDFVAGIREPFPLQRNIRLRESKRKQSGNEPCLYEGATPSCVKTHYNITMKGGRASNNSMAVAEFAGSFYSPTDLRKFQDSFNLIAQPVSVVKGPNDAGSPGTEASLDIQVIMAIAQGVPSQFLSFPKSSQTPFLDWALSENTSPKTAWVHAVSWGTEEFDYAKDGNLDRLNMELMKFGVRGVTVIFATGDNGAGCHLGKYETNYPASSPYVTAVGGTWIPPTTTTYKIEGDEISGGGFAADDSNNRTAAPWQEAAVQGYLNSPSCPSKRRFVETGRGTPDVAAYDAYYPVIIGGGQSSVDGTSAAAPVWGGIVALLNERRFLMNKPSMGFLNPWLYGLKQGLTDITKGRNSGTAVGGHACDLLGYFATKGWDPVTGLGTPKFGELIDAV